MRFVVHTYPGFALGRQDDDRQLPTDALFKNDAIYIHVHPLVELAPLAVLRPERSSLILENLGTSNMIPVIMAVDDKLDWFVRDFLDFSHHVVSRDRIDGIRHDHAITGDQDHVAMKEKAEAVSVLGHLSHVELRT